MTQVWGDCKPLFRQGWLQSRGKTGTFAFLHGSGKQGKRRRMSKSRGGVLRLGASICHLDVFLLSSTFGVFSMTPPPISHTFHITIDSMCQRLPVRRTYGFSHDRGCFSKKGIGPLEWLVFFWFPFTPQRCTTSRRTPPNPNFLLTPIQKLGWPPNSTRAILSPSPLVPGAEAMRGSASTGRTLWSSRACLWARPPSTCRSAGCSTCVCHIFRGSLIMPGAIFSCLAGNPRESPRKAKRTFGGR